MGRCEAFQPSDNEDSASHCAAPRAHSMLTSLRSALAAAWGRPEGPWAALPRDAALHIFTMLTPVDRAACAARVPRVAAAGVRGP